MTRLIQSSKRLGFFIPWGFGYNHFNDGAIGREFLFNYHIVVFLRSIFQRFGLKYVSNCLVQANGWAQAASLVIFYTAPRVASARDIAAIFVGLRTRTYKKRTRVRYQRLFKKYHTLYFRIAVARSLRHTLKFLFKCQPYFFLNLIFDAAISSSFSRDGQSKSMIRPILKRKFKVFLRRFHRRARRVVRALGFSRFSPIRHFLFSRALYGVRSLGSRYTVSPMLFGYTCSATLYARRISWSMGGTCLPLRFYKSSRSHRPLLQLVSKKILNLTRYKKILMRRRAKRGGQFRHTGSRFRRSVRPQKRSFNNKGSLPNKRVVVRTRRSVVLVSGRVGQRRLRRKRSLARSRFGASKIFRRGRVMISRYRAWYRLMLARLTLGTARGYPVLSYNIRGFGRASNFRLGSRRVLSFNVVRAAAACRLARIPERFIIRVQYARFKAMYGKVLLFRRKKKRVLRRLYNRYIRFTQLTTFPYRVPEMVTLGLRARRKDIPGDAMPFPRFRLIFRRVFNAQKKSFVFKRVRVPIRGRSELSQRKKSFFATSRVRRSFLLYFFKLCLRRFFSKRSKTRALIKLLPAICFGGFYFYSRRLLWVVGRFGSNACRHNGVLLRAFFRRLALRRRKKFHLLGPRSILVAGRRIFRTGRLFKLVYKRATNRFSRGRGFVAGKRTCQVGTRFLSAVLSNRAATPPKRIRAGGHFGGSLKQHARRLRALLKLQHRPWVRLLQQAFCRSFVKGWSYVSLSKLHLLVNNLASSSARRRRRLNFYLQHYVRVRRFVNRRVRFFVVSGSRSFRSQLRRTLARISRRRSARWVAAHTYKRRVRRTFGYRLKKIRRSISSLSASTPRRTIRYSVFRSDFFSMLRGLIKRLLGFSKLRLILREYRGSSIAADAELLAVWFSKAFRRYWLHRKNWGRASRVFKRIFYRTFRYLVKRSCLTFNGIVVTLTGRFQKKQRTDQFTCSVRRRRMPLSNLTADIDFGQSVFLNITGASTVRVWVWR